MKLFNSEYYFSITVLFYKNFSMKVTEGNIQLNLYFKSSLYCVLRDNFLTFYGRTNHELI